MKPIINTSRILLLVFIIGLVASSCKGSTTDELLTVNDSTEVASKNISNLQDSIDFTVFDKPASIIIDSDSVSESTEIVVSTSEITQHNFPLPINPVTPLISIEVSQPLSKPLKVRIPVSKTDNQVTAAVSYQFNNNLLDTLDSVFTDDEILEIMVSASVDFFISSVAEELVLATIDSGFRPSVDGFQITNYRNYWEPLGMCSGMVNGSMYYYLMKKGKSGLLYNHYREYPNMPFETINFFNDDMSAISLATTLQGVDNPPSTNDKFLAIRLDPPATHFYRMAYHMMLSNKPQIVHLYDKPFSADRSNDPTIGHAVIVYRISANHAYVYDPNYPTNETLRLELNLANDKLVPYVGATSAGGTQTQFTTMLYYPYENILNDSAIRTVFNRLENAESLVTIPNYELVEVIKNNDRESFTKLAKKHITSQDTIEITLKNPANGYVKVYDANQQYIELINNNRVVLNLPEKDNYFGFEVFLPSAANSSNIVFSDFQWVQIQKAEYEPWTVVSTIISMNPDHYSEDEINQMLNTSFSNQLMILVDDENQFYHSYNPNNNAKVSMTMVGNNLSYVDSYVVDGDQIVDTFEGVLSSDGKTITGSNIYSVTGIGEMYRISVVITKNE